MADAPPAAGKRKPGRPRKSAPKPADLPLEAAAEAAAAEALKDAGGDSDTPPGAEPGSSAPPRKRQRVTKKGTQQIEEGLREILQMPAVPASIFGEDRKSVV